MQMLSGIEYIKCELACKHDKTMEKEVWDSRLTHFDSIDWSDTNTFKKASDPIGLRAAYMALLETKAKKESGYMVSLDASSSGLQLLSLLVECPTSFALCGGNHNKCVDSYTTIYSEMNLHGALTRKQVKDAIMTSLYGSKATPEATFQENIDVFYETMELMAPGAWDLNQGLQELWDEVIGSTYDWVLPDNFHACIETKDRAVIKITFLGEQYDIPMKIDGRPDFHKGLGPNMIHSVDGMIVREMFRRCMYDQKHIQQIKKNIQQGKCGLHGKSAQIVTDLWDNYLNSGYLSVRILDYLHHDTLGLVNTNVIMALINTLPERPFDLVSVHDCFRCHPNYGNDLRIQYNRILCDIKNSQILSDMAKQIAHRGIKTRKVGTIDDSVVLNANYTLT